MYKSIVVYGMKFRKLESSTIYKIFDNLKTTINNERMRIIMKYIKVQDIYDQIISNEDYMSDSDSRSRLLRKKFNFIMEKILFCRKDDFKVSGHYAIPVLDAPIVKNLLVQSLDQDSIICDWFNGSLDLSNSLNAVLLYNVVKAVVMEPEMQGITDAVTTDEWLAVIRTVIDYENAKKTLQMQQLLEKLRQVLLAQSHQINLGEIVTSDVYGNRRVAMTSKNVLQEKIDEIVDSLVGTVKSADEYFDIINCLLKKFIHEGHVRAEKDISLCANIKETFELVSARDMANQDPDEPRMASEYIAFYNNIHQYLKNNAEVVNSIENKTGVKGLLDFFDMSK